MITYVDGWTRSSCKTRGLYTMVNKIATILLCGTFVSVSACLYVGVHELETYAVVRNIAEIFKKHGNNGCFTDLYRFSGNPDLEQGLMLRRVDKADGTVDIALVTPWGVTRMGHACSNETFSAILTELTQAHCVYKKYSEISGKSERGTLFEIEWPTKKLPTVKVREQADTIARLRMADELTAHYQRQWKTVQQLYALRSCFPQAPVAQ